MTSFGESHGPGVGGVIDGFPAGITIDMDFVQQELNRRRPGQSLLTTSRQEPDKVEFLSGIFEGKSTGCSVNSRIMVQKWGVRIIQESGRGILLVNEVIRPRD